MSTVNVHAAKSNLSRLLEQVTAGEEVVIARAGKPIARLVPYDTGKLPPRKLGTLEGKITIPDDFDTMFQDEIAEMFEGR